MRPSQAGEKPLIIPVFIPHAGCPHRCVFCNQSATTGQIDPLPTPDQIRAAIERFLTYPRRRDAFNEIAFFGGNFLGLTADRIERLLELAQDYIRSNLVQGIRFSTRPDTLDPRKLELISPYTVSTIELGVQSLNANVLRQSRRGHRAAETQAAVALIREQTGYRLGLQMMIGLPGDSAEGALATARRMAGWSPDFVRIYPTLVLEGSVLEQWQARGRYTPLSLEAAVVQAKDLYLLFSRQGIDVIRMGLQPTDELNAGAAVKDGPFHPAFGELVLAALWLDALGSHFSRREFRQKSVTLTVHPKKDSQVRGQKNGNLVKLAAAFGLSSIQVRQDAHLPPDTVLVDGDACPFPT